MRHVIARVTSAYRSKDDRKVSKLGEKANAEAISSEIVCDLR